MSCYFKIHLLWYPVFVPQITGLPAKPGEDMLNWSSTQSPMAGPDFKSYSENNFSGLMVYGFSLFTIDI